MFNIGDKVKTVKATRHGMIEKGTVGTVVEIRLSGNDYSDGIAVEFMRKPSPQVAKVFGQDPNIATPFRCLFPHKSVSKQITKA